VQFPFST